MAKIYQDELPAPALARIPVAGRLRELFRSTSLRERFRCRICWRITFFVFASIMIIEGIILVPSYLSRERDLLKGIELIGLAEVKGTIERAEGVEAGWRFRRELADLTVLEAAVILGDAGEVLDRLGEAPPPGPDVEGRLELAWNATALGLPARVIAWLDTGSVAPALAAYTARVGALVLVITLFVCLMTAIILHLLILGPMLGLRKMLVAAEHDHEHADRYFVGEVGRNEIGEMANAINHLLARVSNAYRSSIRERESRFQDFADATSDWFWEMDAELRFSYFSDRFTEVTGVPHEALMGKTRQETGIPDVDAASWEKHLTNLTLRRAFRGFVHPRTQDDGSIVWLSINGKPVFDETGAFVGYRGTGSDITDRKLAEEGLQESEQRLKAVMNHIPAALFLKDLDARYVLVNKQFEDWLGIDAATVRGKSSHDLFPKQHADRYDLSDRKILESWKVISEQVTIPLVFGETRTFEVTRFPIIDEGTPTGFGGIILDLTDRIEVERALRESEALAEQSNRAKSAFLANMSHELRTPLNAVVGFSHLLRETLSGPDTDARHGQYAENIHASSQILMQLISDVLDLSKIEAGHLELEAMEIDLPGLFEEVRNIWGERARQGGLLFEIEIGEGVPCTVVGDLVRLRQVIYNLLGNAFKFTTEGRVAFRAALLSTGAEEILLRFEVADSGIGIPDQVLPTLFDEFAQADNSTTREFGGTGLGLAICRNIVRMMGGEIHAMSTPGEGSTFSFTARLRPVARAMDLDEAGANHRPCSRDAGAPEARRVLVAEDHKINQVLIRAMLEGAGYRVDIVSDGEDAISAVRRGRYDLVLMDIQMPRMDGMTAAGAIRALEGDAARTPIVALTANAMSGDRAKYLSAGMNGYVSKPIDAERLFATIDECLGSTVA